MTRRWFGTDGIRGVANVDLTAELALAVGRAAAAVLSNDGRTRLLVGRDTRRSGPMLEAALAAGVASAGGEAMLAGVIPTPGVSRLVAAGDFSGGVVVSASHNPFADNGIKLFGADGKKLPDAVELEIEAHMAASGRLGSPAVAVDAEVVPASAGAAVVDAAGRFASDAVGPEAVGLIEAWPAAGPRYVDDLLRVLAVDLAGMKVLLDCAHGATYQVAPLAFGAAGAQVEVMSAEPDGLNINAGCGSTDLTKLGSRVVQGDFDLGLAFDGDGDRVLAVDATGRPVDGDQILTVLATWLAERRALAGDTVVVTSMSNLGFHRAMAERGIAVEVTDVGDRYVLERMERVGAGLGGEQSGHVIYLGAGATGDGIQTGLLLCQAVLAAGATLADLAGMMRRFPQFLLNVRVADKSRLSTADEVWAAVRAEEQALGVEGRIVLRPSGTESLVRVMVEAPTEARCGEVAGRLAEVVGRVL